MPQPASNHRGLVQVSRARLLEDRPRSRRVRHLAVATALVVALLATSAGATAVADRVAAPHVSVSLLSAQQAVRLGEPVDVGLLFELEEHWHVYWQNPGDSGEPPRVRWTLPDGFAAQPVTWPTPVRVDTGPIVNYAYEHEVLLPVTLTTSAQPRQQRAPGEAGNLGNPGNLGMPRDPDERVDFVADVSWLVCRAEECIPGTARLALALPLTSNEPPVNRRTAALFARARAAVPSERSASFEQVGERGVRVTIPDFSLRDGAILPTVSFFPLRAGTFEHFRGTAEVSTTGDLTILLRSGDLAPAHPDSVAGLVVVEAGSMPIERDAFVVHALPAGAAAGASMPWSLVLLFAFLGGVLLNLMPCVFPVLSLKILGFVEQAHHDPRRVRLHGWAFAAGVVASFWALAATLIALRAGGAHLGWGFQLQSPTFIALLSVVLLAFALSLSGVFDVGLVLTRLGGHGGAVGGYASSLWTGALATVVATPCTAPLMGPALGFALTQPPLASLVVFTALAGGMAAPYVLLAHVPRLLAWLPRPGPWMQTVRQLTAFPLYATVLWLLYVFSHQTSLDATWRLMIGLLAVAMAVWGWGIVQRRPGRGLARFALVPAMAVVALAIVLSAARRPYEPARLATAGSAHEGFWKPWSPETVAALQADGKPVFVNFTADWCISCQVNERTVFSSDPVRELFASYAVTPLKADWTSKDERIARALAAFGREGVPLYVFYPGDTGATPTVLPQLPTMGALREAFASGERRAQQHRLTEAEGNG